MLYSQTIKNLISGVSQQPPILRLPEQLEEQLNGWSTEASGLQKRPATVFVKTLSDALSDVEPLVHFVDRDEDIKYFVYFYNNEVSVIDIDGNKHDVVYSEDKDYLATSKPQKHLRVITIADHTFIVNRTKKVTMRSEKSPDYFNTQGALIHVKQGQYGRTYTIWADGAQVASYTTPDGSDKSHTTSIDTSNIAATLATQARNKGYTVDCTGCWLRIQNVSKVVTKDGYNNNAMIGITSKVQKFSLLPASAPDNYCVEVVTEPDGGSSGSYYVKYSEADSVWTECVAPNMELGYDKSTMPHELVRQADGTFVFQQVDWADREVGDDDSNPLPSFVDNYINDIFFHRNRLGFLSGENVICSESAEYFNFWMSTANDILDTDPIDVPTTTTRINILNYAVPFNSELYCFSDKTQFVLRADTVLSPKNTALIEVTEFNSSPDCRPVVAARNLYFASKRAEFTSIKEFYSVQQVSDEKNAQDITAHVPDYIPNGVYHIESSTSENIMLFLTHGDSNCIYVYKYLFMNENRVQASWSKWDMGGEIYAAFFVGSTLYILMNRGGKHILEKMNFSLNTTTDFDSEPYRIHLDCKKLATTATYDDEYEQTTFDVQSEYDFASIDNMSDVCLVTNTGKVLRDDNFTIDGNKIIVSGNYTKQDVYIGFIYNFKATLSPIYIRQTDSNGSTKADLSGRLQVRYIKLQYSDTGYFKITVNNKYEYIMTAKVVAETKLDVLSLKSGIFKVPIQMLNTSCNVVIESDAPLPLALLNLMWEGSWSQRSRGV